MTNILILYLKNGVFGILPLSFSCKILLFLSLFFDATATQYGVIICGRATDEESLSKMEQHIELSQDLLVKNGVSESQIHIFHGEGGGDIHAAKRELIINKLQSLAEASQPDDITWVFLFGHANTTSRGVSITTRGPRLRGSELSKGLQAIQGQKLVFCLNRQSVAMLPLLKKDNHIVLTATDDIRQMNPPVLTSFFLQEWAQSDDASLFSIVREASERTEHYYNINNLARAENALLFDGEQVSAYPFHDVTWGHAMDFKFAGLRKVSRNESSDENPGKGSLVPMLDLEDEVYEQQDQVVQLEDSEEEPTQESLRHAGKREFELLRFAEDAKTKYLGYAACYLKKNLSLTVHKNYATDRKVHKQILLLEDIAGEEFNRFAFPRQLGVSSELKRFRLLFPDGKFRDLEMDRSARMGNLIRVNGLRKGCILDIEYAIKSDPNSDIPFMHETLIVSDRYPVASSKVDLYIPKKRFLNHRLYNCEVPAVLEETEFSRKISYDFGELPSYESMPYSLPHTETASRIVLSNVESWEQFHEFVGRVLKGVCVLNEDGKTLVAQLTKGATSDATKLRKLYNYICDLRYETRPLGLRGLRPQLPAEVIRNRFADCKDKANALVAMAREVGIEGYFVLLNRSLSTDESFPSWQFNHAVAFFPSLEGYPDGLWVDATDGATPFASLPPGDVGRVGMLVHGDELDSYAFKKVFPAQGLENRLEQRIELDVERGGKLSGNLSVQCRGLFDYYYRNEYKRLTPAMKRYHTASNVNDVLSLVDVASVEHSDLTDLNKAFHLNASLKGYHASETLSDLDEPYGVIRHFLSEERSYTTRINDGQAFRMHQQVIIDGMDHLSQTLQPFFWEKNSDVLYTSVDLKLEEGKWVRQIIFDLKQPDLPASIYTKVRKQVQDWVVKMRINFGI